MGGHGRTGTVVANLMQAVEGGGGFADAMVRLRERHRKGRKQCSGGHCALSCGELEDESQEAQAKRLVPAMSRQHAINKNKTGVGKSAKGAKSR
jgi:protein-tyrosine phosphatase